MNRPVRQPAGYLITWPTGHQTTVPGSRIPCYGKARAQALFTEAELPEMTTTTATELNASDRAVAAAVCETMQFASMQVIREQLENKAAEQQTVYQRCKLVLQVSERYAMTLPRSLRPEFFTLCGAHAEDVPMLVERNIKGEDHIAAAKALAAATPVGPAQ